jgi:hypothetical protein
VFSGEEKSSINQMHHATLSKILPKPGERKDQDVGQGQAAFKILSYTVNSTTTLGNSGIFVRK